MEEELDGGLTWGSEGMLTSIVGVCRYVSSCVLSVSGNGEAEVSVANQEVQNIGGARPNPSRCFVCSNAHHGCNQYETRSRK
jgi:hypothetical protein